MRKAVVISRAAVVVFLGLFLLANLWMLFEKLAYNKALPKLFGYSQAVALSGSMEPEFLVGDMLVFKEKEAYSVGDVVIFNKNGSLVTHRIVGETDEGFLTKGDANNTLDTGSITASEIEGKMTMVIPWAGEALDSMKTPLGIFIIGILGFIMLALPYIANILKREGEC